MWIARIPITARSFLIAAALVTFYSIYYHQNEFGSHDSMSSSDFDAWYLRHSTATSSDRSSSRRNDNHHGPLNILILYPDDLRHDSLQDDHPPGFIHTPNLSQLAKEGIRFTSNCVTASICWISRATLFTGRYATKHHSDWPMCPVFTLNEFWRETWVAILQRFGGYWVGHSGKWQYKNSDSFFLNAFNWSNIHEGSHWDVLKNGTKIHSADYALQDFQDFLRSRPRDRPFALTVAFFPPKPVQLNPKPGAQWSPNDKWKEIYSNKTHERPYNLDICLSCWFFYHCCCF